MLTFFIVENVDSTTCTAHAAMDEGIAGTFYLPPLSRPETSNIQTGSRFLGVLDEASGIGALLCGIGDADFKRAFGYDLAVDGSLQTSGDVKATGDVKAGVISLSNHVHTCASPGSPSSTPVITT